MCTEVVSSTFSDSLTDILRDKEGFTMEDLTGLWCDIGTGTFGVHMEYIDGIQAIGQAPLSHGSGEDGRSGGHALDDDDDPTTRMDLC